MTKFLEDKKIYQKFCMDLTERYLNELSGNGKNDKYIIGQRPTEKIAIGILDSGFSNDEMTRYTSMPMMKVQFFTNKNKTGKIALKIKGNLYYNVIPTFNEVIEYNEKKEKIAKEQDLTGITEEEQQEFKKISIVQKFKRNSVDEILKDIVISKEELLTQKKIDVSDQINDKLKNALDFSEAYFFKDRTIMDKKAIENEEEYNKYINTHTGNSDSQIFKGVIDWRFSAIVTAKESSNSEIVTITVTIKNITEKPEGYKPKEEEIKRYCLPLYNSGLEIEGIEGFEFISSELDYIKKSYKTTSSVITKGEWLSAEYLKEENKIITNNVPRYIEKRLLTNDKYSKNASFIELQKEPIKNLRIILNGMEDYYEEIASLNYSEQEYISDLKKFKFEIKRFKRGIQLLEDPDFENIFKAFILMNKTFENSGYSSWRLFQIVFIVSMISDIVYNDNRDILESEIYNYEEYKEAEIIYFPTGGGKTEAFLGTVVLSCFYDRFSGKNYGVNTIIKYPLRLLSIQQLDRTFNILYKANNVMLQNDEIKNCQPFSLGYFVGSSNTPNKIENDEIDKILEQKSSLTLIEKCPCCNSNLTIEYNKTNKLLEHVCTNEKCKYILPLYIVDDDIYRKLPTVIISTVDKLASISFKDEFRNILGVSQYKCPKHGFMCKNKCTYDINDKVYNIYEVQKKSMAPSLFIQDEVHLLKESLGVFSAHYESLIEYIISETIDKKYAKKIKYIGATATISGADSLVKELYGKECRIFPSPSTYSDGRNFYSYHSEEEISRIILGYAPFGDSINSRIEYSVSTLRIILNEMLNNSEEYCKNYSISKDEFENMINYYWTSIIYTRSKKDNNNLRNTFEQQANIGRLNEISGAEFNIVRMTGDEDFSQIKETLNSMQLERDKQKANNLILATSTISHGVDSKDFNNIFFYGIPSNTAEYIQSYSRVGRTFTGIVVDIIRLAKNRDVSFLKYFNMMHEYKDFLVDENRLNTKSVIAMYHTFPGIFESALRHHYSTIYGKNFETLGQIDKLFYPNGNLDKNIIIEFLNILCKIYRCDDVKSDSSINANFKKHLMLEYRNLIFNLHNNINNGYSVNQKINGNIADFTSNPYKAMTSLRDVDRTYEIGIRFGRDSYEEK